MVNRKTAFGEKLFRIGNYSFLTIVSLSFLLPFLVILSTSFVSENELIRRGSFILIPQKLDVTAYKVLLSGTSTLYHAYYITIMRVVIGTALNLIITAMMAYGLARKQLPGRNAVIALIFVTMLIDGGLIPNYLLMKGLHLTNTFWVMVLPGLVSAWYLIIMKNFFTQIPESLEESAMIDGASPLRILVSIVVPLSLPTFATIGLFYAVGHWNAWFDAMIYITDTSLLPVQAIMRQIVLQYSSTDINQSVIASLSEKPTAESVKAAAIMVTTLPILLIYPFLQKHFVKGVLTGSVKG
ncbi:carbohydrate ABC transporter permease [Paenibacillus nasutitermitis]|uniref:ABC transporter permease n=1 Tax=Paenibacillus nasutitermitis TaxID=1652958 RepID=A0A917DMA0_9BACL|nr:carbohydrate ABC transporter permease [Paenibacillus nasutitermitis]GGD50893.1 ABC transporter permease [Paenibacillus nasutitermitis]